MKKIITEVAITAEGKNPTCEAFIVRPESAGGGSYLKLVGEDDTNNGNYLLIEWNEWDAIVEVVAQYRKQWEWNENGEPVQCEKEGSFSH